MRHAPRALSLLLLLPLGGCGLLDAIFGGSSGGTPDPGRPTAPEPYPIVLAHGFFGFDDFAGWGFLTYFYEVQPHLLATGETEVFTPTVDPFNDSVTRGEQLADRILDVLATTGAEKVNLIGHSQGGLDARYVAATYPELVDSVTTIATPHHGSPVADLATGVVPFPGIRDLADFFVQFVGMPLWDEVGDETSLFASLEQLSTSGMSRFNLAYPDSPDVAYYSIAGVSDRHDGGDVCDVPDAPAFIRRWASERDAIAPMFWVTEPLLDGGPFTPVPNDGLVRAEDAVHGRFLGCIPADHTDQIGQILGDGPGSFNEFDHLAFYVDLVRWLRAQGH